MPIDSARPLNINIQIQNANAGNLAEVTASASTGAADQVAPKNFAGRTVTLIKDVSKWAATETAAFVRHEVKTSIDDIKAGVAFIAKKFGEAVRSLQDKYHAYRADKKANKEFSLSTARAEKRSNETFKSSASTRLLQPKLQSQVATPRRQIDQETRDIQIRLKLLKLPDVPSHDPNVPKSGR